MGNGIFTEEVINSWLNGRCRDSIATTCHPDEVRRLIIQSMANTVRFNGMVSSSNSGRKYSVLTH